MCSCSCSCSWSAFSSCWCYYGSWTGSRFSLAPQKVWPNAAGSHICSSLALQTIAPPVVSTPLPRRVEGQRLGLFAPGARSKADGEHPSASTPRGVLPLSMVENSAFSPTGLTVSSDSAYDAETFHATHIKQRGSLWPFICSCSCSWSVSSLWRYFGVFAGSLFSLPIYEERPSVARSTVC